MILTLRAASTTPSGSSLKRIIKIKEVLNFANQNEVQPDYNYCFFHFSHIISFWGHIGIYETENVEC